MRRLSELEKVEIWDRFEAGESLRSISRRLGRPPSSIRTHVVKAGFRRPVPGPEWSPRRLSLREREEISRGLAVGESMRSIGRRLGRAASTVSREVAANGDRVKYRATVAHRASRHRARRPKPAKLVINHRLRDVVEAKLELWWSPSQISEWLVPAYPDDCRRYDTQALRHGQHVVRRLYVHRLARVDEVPLPALPRSSAHLRNSGSRSRSTDRGGLNATRTCVDRHHR